MIEEERARLVEERLHAIGVRSRPAARDVGLTFAVVGEDGTGALDRDAHRLGIAPDVGAVLLENG
jgi:hypothetical protein